MAIKRLRKERRLSQYALAGQAGISREYIRRLEDAESDPTVASLGKIARALGVSLAAIIDSREELEAMASAVVAGSDGDHAVAMSVLVGQIRIRPALVLCSWEELRASGSKERPRAPEVVEVARGYVSTIPVLAGLPESDPRRRTITFLARGLADLLEGEAAKQHRYPPEAR